MNRLLGGRLPILAYHGITDDFPHYLSVSPSTFRGQLRFLRDRGFRALSLPEAASALAAGTVPEQAIVFTFDDAYRDFQTHAAPIMAELGFTGTVFAISETLTNPSVLAEEKYSGARVRLTVPELREVRRAGHDVGSHSMTHPHLRGLPADALRHELVSSKTCLEEALGEPVFSFCYPFGEYGPRELVAVREAGYGCACTFENWIANGASADVYALKRFDVQRYHSLADLRVMVEWGVRPPALRAVLRRRRDSWTKRRDWLMRRLKGAPQS